MCAFPFNFQQVLLLKSNVGILSRKLAHKYKICFHKPVKSKTKNGFVLVELLLSLTVMTLLFGVSLKAYQYIRETTRSTQASEQASKIRKVFEAYLHTYGHCPKGIFPIEQWFDLSRKKPDFKAVFSGKDKNANLEGINFIQQVGLKEDALKKPLWIFLCHPLSKQTATLAWTRLEQLRNRTTEWEQIGGIDFVFSYRPQHDEDYRTLLEQKIEREREKNGASAPLNGFGNY